MSACTQVRNSTASTTKTTRLRGASEPTGRPARRASNTRASQIPIPISTATCAICLSVSMVAAYARRALKTSRRVVEPRIHERRGTLARCCHAVATLPVIPHGHWDRGATRWYMIGASECQRAAPRRFRSARRCPGAALCIGNAARDKPKRYWRCSRRSSRRIRTPSETKPCSQIAELAPRRMKLQVCAAQMNTST